MSSDDVNDIFSSDEEGDHNVENFLLFSFARPACSPLSQGFLHEIELGKVALICHFSSDVNFSLFGFSGFLSLELSLWHPVASFLTLQICRAPRTRLGVLVLSFTCCHLCSPLLQRLSLLSVKDGLQQHGDGFDGRHGQALLGDASRSECFFNVLPVRSFLEEEGCFSGHLCCRRCQPEDRQSGTGSVVVTARRATTPPCQSTIKQNKTMHHKKREDSFPDTRDKGTGSNTPIFGRDRGCAEPALRS